MGFVGTCQWIFSLEHEAGPASVSAGLTRRLRPTWLAAATTS